MTPLQAGFVGAALRMTSDDLVAAAARLGVSVAVVSAVLEVESSGRGFDAANRPKILFEPHIFFRELAGKPVQQAAAVRAGLAYPHQGEQAYPPTSEINYQRLKRACLLDMPAALRSASWGIAQVMGFNSAICGYPSAEAMVEACMLSEAAQFNLLIAYCEKHGLVGALRARNWAGFARGYNGAGAVPAYSAKLLAAYARHSAAPGGPLVPSKRPGTPPAARMAAPSVTADSLNDTEWLKIRAGQGA